MEQSDLVMVLLNLGVIPDSVARKIDFNPGWQKRFRLKMSTFKLDFSEANVATIEKWKYQDGELEDKYKEFVTAKELEDELLQSERKEWQIKIQGNKDAQAEEELQAQSAAVELAGGADDDFAKVKDAAPAEAAE